MKAVTATLHACSGLMLAAAVMGAVHYRAAKLDGKLEKLYKDGKTMAIGTKTIEVENYSRAAIAPIPEADSGYRLSVPAAKHETKKGLQKPTSAPASRAIDNPLVNLPVELLLKKKKIRFSEFSRAALPIVPVDEKLDTLEAGSQDN